MRKREREERKKGKKKKESILLNLPWKYIYVYVCTRNGLDEGRGGGYVCRCTNNTWLVNCMYLPSERMNVKQEMYDG
jgi:hypothetical protein